MTFKTLVLLMALASLAQWSTGCGVRQFGARLPPPSSNGLNGFGPFYASGQGSGTMSASSCASSSHHPCARVRASVGIPYQFDVNPNNVQGPVRTGTTFSAPAPYSGIAGGPQGTGAGRSAASANKPQIENIDLFLLKNQSTMPAQAF